MNPALLAQNQQCVKIYLSIYLNNCGICLPVNSLLRWNILGWVSGAKYFKAGSDLMTTLFVQRDLCTEVLIVKLISLTMNSNHAFGGIVVSHYECRKLWRFIPVC